MKVKLSPRALSDIENVRRYIAKQAGSQEVADRCIDRLLDACRTLEFFAGRFPPYHIAGDVRMMPFENSYLVIFEILGEEVHIIHIRHAARRPLRKK